MPRPVPEHAVVGLLRQCFTTPRCQALNWTFNNHQESLRQTRLHSLDFFYKTTNKGTQRRALTTKSGSLQVSARPNVEDNRRGESDVKSATDVGRQDKKPEKIAVLGGGITGLASAHYLAREFPDARITIYEGSNRVGGWLESKKVEVENGTVLFESGPRTLRCNAPAAMVTLELITHLGLQDQILATRKDSVAAQNRFIYYPDRLVRMPGMGQNLSSVLWSLLTEPVFKGLLSGIAGEYKRAPRQDFLEDESIGAFLERRLGSPELGNNILSAVLHGIYAGDIYQLSAKSLMPKFWHDEALHGSIVKSSWLAMTAGFAWMQANDVILQNELVEKVDSGLVKSLGSASLYTFKDGIGSLSTALERNLLANANVEFKMSENVQKIHYDGENDQITIASDKNQSISQYDNVISTLPGRTISRLVRGALPSLAGQHSVTVMVVNLYYRDPDLLAERGFGYLIPCSVPFEQNPECALGVVFDSDSSVGQDTASGTKVTVMIGGHWWDGFDSYPDEKEGIKMAKAVLRRHLRISDEPEAVNVALHMECIPQYVVGHEASLKAAHHDLLSGFKGKLRVAGSSYKGVGLNDCVRSARDVVMGLRTGKATTGLDEYSIPKAWARGKLRVS